MVSSSLPPPPVVLSSRRKPRITYKSPSEEDSCKSEPFTIPTVTQKLVSSSSASMPILSKVSPHVIKNAQPSPRRWISSIPPLLPLYHPLGHFALSLPPLNPTSIGLPCPAGLDDTIRRSSSRARRPAAKLRDGEEETPPPIPPTISELEEREKPSPRKRRAGGGNASKRKRKEGDDDDATYPAKRTRMPRGANQNQALEDDSLAELTVPAADCLSTPELAPEDRQPERRSTRSRGMVRRDSSTSEAETEVGAGFKREMESRNMNVEPPFSDDGRNEKEEGELSEESRSNHLEYESR
jgi:hypothetical protein